MQNALNVVAKWAVKEGLNISPHKTAMVPFTNRRKIEGLGPLKLHGKDIKMLDEVRYLGVTLDSRLNWLIKISRFLFFLTARLHLRHSVAQRNL